MTTTNQLSALKSRILEKYARGEMSRAVPAPDAIRPSLTRPAPLSVAQQEFYFRETSSRAVQPLYNEGVSLCMKGALDERTLERSFAEIIRRHEIWRTSYAKVNRQLVQIVGPAEDVFRFPVHDFRSTNQTERTSEIQEFMDGETCRPFDLGQGPLVRAHLLKTGAEEHILFIVAHLSVVDGVSVYQILPAELAVLYQAFAAGKSSPLPEPAVQFADFALWQRERLDRHVWGDQIAYWGKQLKGTPLFNWPRNHSDRTATKAFRGVIRPEAFSSEVTERTKYLSRVGGVTLFVTLVAGFAALLHTYTEQTDLVIGTFSPSGRQRPELRKLLGHFINPVALRLEPGNDLTFRELMQQACDVIGEAMKRDMVPLEALKHEIPGKPVSVRDPLFNFGISLQPPMPSIAYDWTITSMDAQSGGSPWNLYMAFIERPTGLMGRIQYDPDAFEESVIKQMWGDLQSLLKIAAARPEDPLSRLRSELLAERQAGLSLQE